MTAKIITRRGMLGSLAGLGIAATLGAAAVPAAPPVAQPTRSSPG